MVSLGCKTLTRGGGGKPPFFHLKKKKKEKIQCLKVPTGVGNHNGWCCKQQPSPDDVTTQWPGSTKHMEASSP